MCEELVTNAADQFEFSMEKFFTGSFDALSEVGSSVDYLLKVFDDDAGSCLDFEKNPTTVTLIPEPFEYFSSCAVTSMCEARCGAEFEAFETVRASSGRYSPEGASNTRKVQRVQVTSPFFQAETDEGNKQSAAALNMEVRGVLELSDCTSVCGDAYEEGDTCVAVAGFLDTGVIVVQKFCVPISIRLGVRLADEWSVAGSGAWADTVTGVWFADEQADALLIKRNGGRDNDDPSQQFLGVYVRYPVMEVDDADTLTRFDLIVALHTGRAVAGWGLDGLYHVFEVTSIADVIVGNGFVFASVHAKLADGSVERTVLCANLDVGMDFLNVMAWNMDLAVCSNIKAVFDIMDSRDYIPVMLRPMRDIAVIAGLPSSSASETMHLVRMNCGYSAIQCEVASVQEYSMPVTAVSNPFETSPTISSRVAIQALGASLSGRSVNAPVASQVATLPSPDTVEVLIARRGGAARGSQWLSSVTYAVRDDSMQAEQRLAVSGKRVWTTVTVEEQCNRRSCSGCNSPLLTNLCYAARQCSVVQCVGSTVNLERVFCNVGGVLQSHAMTWLTAAHGAWKVVAETYRNILTVSLNPGADRFTAEFVDDSFYSVVCSAKDELAQISALITSIIGHFVLNFGRTKDLPNLDGTAYVNLDTRQSAKDSLILTGTTSMLYQMALAPLFAIVSVQKVITCTTNGLIATVTDTSKFDLTIGRNDLRSGSDAMAGECLSPYIEGKYNEGDYTATATVASDIIAMSGSIVSYLSFEFILHPLDALFAYFQGVVSGVQDLVQNVDEVHCRVPKYDMQNVLQCACGDTPVFIPYANGDQSEFWCTGTIKLWGSFGGFIVVHNPYTYNELETDIGTKAEAYLACLSSPDTSADSANCQLPFPPSMKVVYRGTNDIEAASIPLLVLQKCKENYHYKRFDEGSWIPGQEGTTVYNNVPADTLACFQQVYDAGGTDFGQCAREYIAVNFFDRSLEDYFRYTHETLRPTPGACVVATGLANNPDPQISAQYRACAMDYVAPVQDSLSCQNISSREEGTCALQMMVWSPDSSNHVPVAITHQVGTSDLLLKAEDMIRTARDNVLCALERVAEWSNDNVDAFLFSGEGDALHQVMDCIFQVSQRILC